MNKDANRVADMLAEAVAALAAGEEYDGMDPELWLQEDVLEIEVHGKRQLGEDEWTVTKVEALLCCGGPTYWVEFEDVSQARVEYHYGSDSSRAHLSPDLAEQLAVIWGIDEVLS
jgi:hypothetical protein